MKIKKMKKCGFTRKILEDVQDLPLLLQLFSSKSLAIFMILFRNVSLSQRKPTTYFGRSRFFRRKVTKFIGRETKTHILPTKMKRKNSLRSALPTTIVLLEQLTIQQGTGGILAPPGRYRRVPRTHCFFCCCCWRGGGGER